MKKGVPEMNTGSSQRPPHGYNRGLTRSSDFLHRNYLRLKTEHYQIDRKLLLPGTTITFSLFDFDNYLVQGMQTRVLVEASETSPAIVDERITAAKGDILIRKRELPLYLGYIDDLLVESSLSGIGENKIPVLATKENAKALLSDIFDDTGNVGKIRDTSRMIDEMIKIISGDRDSLYDMLTYKSRDFYAYTHSVNVAALSIGLGMAAELDGQELKALGLGAILHDVGKSTIPPEILNRQGRLDDREFEIIKNHVPEGEQILRAAGVLPEESYPVIVLHHEKLSGRGYPGRLRGDEITLFGRIAAIADCFDAMTTQGACRYAFTPYHALSVIVRETGDFDAHLLRAFVQMLGKMR